MPEQTSGIAAHLRRLRLRAGLSQEALAEKSGVSVATIGALEEGQRRRPYPHTLRALADSLELSGPDRSALLSTPEDESYAPQPTLPMPLTALVGREAEVEQITAQLHSTGVRVLTLVGPGGVGKTRLAIEVAARLADVYAHGAAFVDLALVHDQRLIPATIARVLGVREVGGRSAWDLVQAYLRPRELLLVLDNFEHLLGAAQLLTELLSGCPRLALLVTSRTALRLRAEHRHMVEPLAVPSKADRLELAEAMSFPAVRLFVDRLRAVTPNFVLHDSNVAEIAEICRQLDGIPLALELAASRVQLLTPRALLQRLQRRLHLLSSGPVDLPARQRTLRDTLAWSYDLLRPADRALFRRLAVFSGGCTLEAAEAVCTAGDVPADDLLGRMSVLVDSSLVQPVEQVSDERYFGMLETVREYALEHLGGEGEERQIRARHLAYYAWLAQTAEPYLYGRDQHWWGNRLQREHDNLRAALTFAAQGGDAVLGLRLAVALRFFWYQHGHLREGADRLRTALAAADAVVDAKTQAQGLASLGYLLVIRGQTAEARLQLEAALNISRSQADEAGMAFALRYLGLVAEADGNPETATTCLEEALALSRRLGLPVDTAWALLFLGDMMLRRHDLERAQTMFEESSTLLAELDYQGMLSYPLRRLAHLARLRGDSSLALELSLQSLAGNRASGDQQGIAACLVALAQIAATRGQPEPAVRLLGLADSFAEAVGGHLLPLDDEQFELVRNSLRSQIDDAAWSRWWSAGPTLSIDEAEAIANAL